MKFDYDDAYDSDKLFAYDSNEEDEDSIGNGLGARKQDDSSDNGYGEENGHVG